MDNQHPPIQFRSVWNRNESDPSGFANFWKAFQEDALGIRKDNSYDGLAIYFAITSDAAFFARFGAAKRPRVHPGPPSGTREQLAVNAIALTAFMLQQSIVEAARTHLLKQAPSHLFEASKDAYGSLHGRSLEFLCTSLLNQVGALSKADIKGLYARIKVPYASGEPIAEFLAVRRDLFRQLAAAGEPLPPSLQITYIMECMEGPIDFTPCWVTFNKDFPATADQTLERLFAAIINHVNVVHPIIATRTDLMINAAVKRDRALLDEVRDLKAQVLALQIGPPAVAATAAAAAVSKGRVFTDGPNVPFCWTHGPCWHRGDAPCLKPASGHKPAATWGNQMGSPWKVLWRSQGRRTE